MIPTVADTFSDLLRQRAFVRVWLARLFGTTANQMLMVALAWQMYEITGIGKGQVVQVRKLPQPADTNNVSPFYGTDDRILFTSDRPRNGSRLLYPQLDEYESQPVVTGIWSMLPNGTVRSWR